MRHTKQILLFSLIIFLFNSCAVNPVTGNREFMLLSKDQERSMGEQSDKSIIQTYGLYDDAQLQQFIKRKGKNMASISHRPGLNYEFKILDSPVVNAFAAPGGFVYFTRGILAHFNNEAEFAGVLGHEIGHVTARHSAKQYSKATAAQVGLIATTLISEDFRQYAGLAQSGLNVLFMKFSRDNESQSDRLGVEYSTKIGYDAHKMAQFFNTLDRQSQGSSNDLPSFLSTHPDPADRFEHVQQLADKWQNKVTDKNFEVNRESYLQMIDGLVYGPDPRQGFFEGNSFYHPDLKLKFAVPPSWKTQNTPTSVQMSPAEGNALLLFTLGQGNDSKTAANNFIKNNQLSIQNSTSVQVNGFSTLKVLSQQKQEQGTVQLISYFIQDGNQVFNFTGLSSIEDFEQYRGTFTNSMESFSRLNDSRYLNKQPERIKIINASQSNRLSAILQQAGVSNNRMEEIALLNGMHLDDQVSNGTMLKIIE